MISIYILNAISARFPGSRLCAIACPGILWAWRQELSMSHYFCELVLDLNALPTPDEQSLVNRFANHATNKNTREMAGVFLHAYLFWQDSGRLGFHTTGFWFIATFFTSFTSAWNSAFTITTIITKIANGRFAIQQILYFLAGQGLIFQ